MALPIFLETSEIPEFTTRSLVLVTDAPWDDVESVEESIYSKLREILGYDPQLIAEGTSTEPYKGASERYDDLMTSLLGYVLEKVEISAVVQEALDEIADGRTLAAGSLEELQRQLNQPEDPTDT